jgi:hypothetical protein
LARLRTFIVPDRRTFPPELAWRGASPSQAQKCVTVGTRLISVPISEMIVWTVPADKPITAPRSTPIIRATYARTLQVGAFFDLDSGWAGGKSGRGASTIQRDSIA